MISDLFEKILHAICSQWTWWWEGGHQKGEVARAILTISIAILGICWYLWRFMKLWKGMPPLPPGPRGLPIAGYFPFLGTNLRQSFAELAQVYGPIYKRWLGNKLYVLLSSASLAKEVVRDQDITFANRDPPIAALAVTYGGSDIAWSPYGSTWRALRKVFVREMMSNTSLDACYELQKHEVQNTIRDVYTKIGTPMDIGEITFLTELNVIMNLLWGSKFEGEKYNSLRAEIRKVASEIIELLGKPNVSDFFPMLARFDIQGVEKQMTRLFLWVDQILGSIVDQRVKMNTASGEEAFNNERKDFLQLLLDLKKQEDSATPISMTQIMALLMDIVVGGTDTTATMAEWVMAEMMCNPEVMKKAQEELAEVVGMNNIVEEAHLPKLLTVFGCSCEGDIPSTPASPTLSPTVS